jgi:hypothetical protein
MAETSSRQGSEDKWVKNMAKAIEKLEAGARRLREMTHTLEHLRRALDE